MRVFCWLMGVCAVLLGSMFPASGEETWYLRVIARSDDRAAQEEKLRVRQAVWAVCPDSAADLPQALPVIRQAAQAVARCRVEIRSWSPSPFLPSAPTLYVTVGEGRGHNWWGVLYRDSLRLVHLEEVAGETETAGVTFVWPLWEWILRLFGG